jgi:hypothetical protein
VYFHGSQAWRNLAPYVARMQCRLRPSQLTAVGSWAMGDGARFGLCKSRLSLCFDAQGHSSVFNVDSLCYSLDIAETIRNRNERDGR